MDAALIAVREDGSQSEIQVSTETLTIGRDNGCTVRVAVASVSRRHCEIDAEDGELVVRDLGSSNGTYVNGDRVQEATLSAGDLIAVGPVVFVVRVGGEPAHVDAAEAFRSGRPAAAPKKKRARTEAPPASDDPFAAAAADESPTTLPDDSSFADFDFDFMDEEDEPKL